MRAACFWSIYFNTRGCIIADNAWADVTLRVCILSTPSHRSSFTIDDSTCSHSLQQRHSVSVWLYSITYYAWVLPGNSAAAGELAFRQNNKIKNRVVFFHPYIRICLLCPILHSYFCRSYMCTSQHVKNKILESMKNLLSARMSIELLNQQMV